MRRVNRKNLCPVCEHPDWCGVSEDRNVAICMRIKSDRQARNGGWVHILSGQVRFVTPEYKPKPVAPIEQRSAIYNKLLIDHLVLSNTHAWDLSKRGLSVEAIEENSYRSVPSFIYGLNVARRLASENLTGVPGFYQKNGWRMNIRGGGFFIPVRDAYSRIQAMQIRLDDGDTKYIWFSSKAISSGAPTHFSKPYLIRRTGEAILTEGSLKADVISHILKTGCIGLAGVSTFSQGFGQKLKRYIPELKTVHVAFDSDFRENEAVRHQMFRLISELKLAGLNTSILTWDEHKGLDDLLAA